MNIPLTCCTATELGPREREQISHLAAGHRSDDAAFAQWAAGYGVIDHDALTQVRVREMVAELVDAGALPDTATGDWRQPTALPAPGVWKMRRWTLHAAMRGNR